MSGQLFCLGSKNNHDFISSSNLVHIFLVKCTCLLVSFISLLFFIISQQLFGSISMLIFLVFHLYGKINGLLNKHFSCYFVSFVVMLENLATFGMKTLHNVHNQLKKKFILTPIGFLCKNQCVCLFIVQVKSIFRFLNLY